MDSFWQQHRSFILKILGGLLVVLVCWIIGSSLTDRSLADIERDVATQKANLRGLEVPPEAAITGTGKALDVLNRRIRDVALRVGETRQGEELPRQVIGDILKMIDRDSELNREAYRRLSAQSPRAAVIKLVGEAREYLVNLAGPANVTIDEDLGFGRPEFEAAEAGRYLMTLKLIIQVVHVAIEERVSEVKSIGIGAPPLGRFATENVFLREYPVSLAVRGRSATVLRFIERLSDPAAFIPVKGLRRLAAEKNEREEDVVVAELDLLALHIDPDSEIR